MCASEAKLDRIQGRNRLTDLEIRNTLLCTSDETGRRPAGRGQRPAHARQHAARSIDGDSARPPLLSTSGWFRAIVRSQQESWRGPALSAGAVELEHQTKHVRAEERACGRGSQAVSGEVGRAESIQISKPEYRV